MRRDSISSRNSRNKKENTETENRIHPLWATLVTTQVGDAKTYTRKDKPIKNTDPEAIYKMLEQGYTQRFIALRLGIDQTTVSFWKRKKDASKIRTI
jgi:DNA-binding NarL/FixJ family response regulator